VLPWSFTTSASSPSVYGDVGIAVANNAGAGSCFSPAAPLGASGALSSVAIPFLVAPDGTDTVTVILLNETSGPLFALADSFTVTPAASTGVQTFVSGTDYSPRSVTSGQFYGYCVTSSSAEPGVILSGGANYYFSGTPTSTPASWTGYVAQIAIAMSIGGGVVPTSSTVSLPGMTPAGHCSAAAENAGAATNSTSFYIAVGTDQITVNNAAVASMEYMGLCTPN
jgi:hypothetical protein